MPAFRPKMKKIKMRNSQGKTWEGNFRTASELYKKLRGRPDLQADIPPEWAEQIAEARAGAMPLPLGGREEGEMKEYQEAVVKIESLRGKAPESQYGALELALTMLRRADRSATQTLVERYHGLRGYAFSRLMSNEECKSLHRKMAEKIICRVLPD